MDQETRLKNIERAVVELALAQEEFADWVNKALANICGYLQTDFNKTFGEKEEEAPKLAEKLERLF
jgi:iron-sulfur cluster repair protein YtfE (RIC family)